MDVFDFCVTKSPWDIYLYYLVKKKKNVYFDCYK